MHIFGRAASLFRPSEEKEAGRDFLDGLYGRENNRGSVFYRLGEDTRRGRKSALLGLVKQRLARDKEYFISLADATDGYHPVIVFAALRNGLIETPELETIVYSVDLQNGLRRLSPEDRENCLRVASGVPARREDYRSVTKLARVMSGKV